MMVDGGMKADMFDANVALGPEGVAEHRGLKETIAKGDVAQGTCEFFGGAVRSLAQRPCSPPRWCIPRGRIFTYHMEGCMRV